MQIARRMCLTSRCLAPFAVLAVLFCAGPAAEAGWISRIGRLAGEAGETGARAGKHAMGALDGPAALVARLPKAKAGSAALAAHATPEGHWKFVNREGEVFTAANADELARVTATLAPELPKGGKLSLYLSEDTVFTQKSLLKDLPADADLHLVAGDRSYRILLKDAAGDGRLLAEVRDNLTLELSEQSLFDEAMHLLERALNKSNIRTLALEPGGPRSLGSAPRYDPVKKSVLVDVIDPANLGTALRKIKGQTALLSGRVDGSRLYFRQATGGEQALDLMDLRRAAEAADVNLVILHSPASHQPGGRNWLWQEVAVAGLDDALKRPTYADFLNGLGAKSGQLTASVTRDGGGRIVFSATQSGEAAIPLPSTLSDWLGELAGHTTGNVAVHAVTAYARDRERQDELDSRIIPGIPSAIQFTYLGLLVLGLLSWQFTAAWWRRVWPPEARAEYRGAIGHVAARIVRGLGFVFLFAPLAGVPGIIAVFFQQVWGLVTAPVRFLRWLGAKLSPKSG